MRGLSRYWGAAFLALTILSSAPQAVAADIRYSDLYEKHQPEMMALTLDDAIALAIRDNRGIQTTYLQRIAQKFELYVSEGKFFPKLTLSTGVVYNKVNGLSARTKDVFSNTTLDLPTGARLRLSTANGLDSSNSSTTSVTLTQPLLKNGGLDANTASVRMARLDEQVNRLALKAILSQTVTQVIYVYRELLRAQEQRRIAEAALQRSKELYEVNKALISSGRMAEVEIFQTEAEVANREVALEEADNLVDTARLALLGLLALEPRTPVIATGPNDIRLKGAELGQALATALAHEPEYLIAQRQFERAKINLDYAKNQQLWDLSLVAGKTQNRGTSGGLGSLDTWIQKYDSSYAGIQLTVPLGDRSIEQATVRASVDLKSQNLRMHETRQIVEQRIRDAVRNVQTRWRQLELSNKARELSLLKLNTEKEKMQVGRTSNFVILSFENDLRNAENARVNAEIAYLNALTDLDHRMGTTLDAWNIPIAEPELAHDEY
jgi:outer membrane protein TolC